ncbi:MAG: hypothetical protein OEY56_09455 [Cyclobacteriaceae bacterium]|nr:hypothetical protein [Cyclobacteriaceae bacterium]
MNQFSQHPMGIRLFLVIGIHCLCFRSLACECIYVTGNPTNLDYSISESDVIATAKIVEEIDSAYSLYYRIEIGQIWKGNPTNQTILTIGSPLSCGQKLEVGTYYLLYGYELNGYVYSHPCSRTTKLSASWDPDYLNYKFHNSVYDSIKFTPAELGAIQTLLSNDSSGSSLSPETVLIFSKNKLLSKQVLIGNSPNFLHLSYRRISPDYLKKVKPEIKYMAMHGVLVIDERDVPEKYRLKDLAFVKKLNKCKLPFPLQPSTASGQNGS